MSEPKVSVAAEGLPTPPPSGARADPMLALIKQLCAEMERVAALPPSSDEVEEAACEPVNRLLDVLSDAPPPVTSKAGAIAALTFLREAGHQDHTRPILGIVIDYLESEGRKDDRRADDCSDSTFRPAGRGEQEVDVARAANARGLRRCEPSVVATVPTMEGLARSLTEARATLAAQLYEIDYIRAAVEAQAYETSDIRAGVGVLTLHAARPATSTTLARILVACGVGAAFGILLSLSLQLARGAL